MSPLVHGTSGCAGWFEAALAVGRADEPDLINYFEDRPMIVDVMKAHLRKIRRESRQEGRQEGEQLGRQEGEQLGQVNAIVALVRDGDLSRERAKAKLTHLHDQQRLSDDVFNQAMANLDA
jgi:hypothetical protein